MDSLDHTKIHILYSWESSGTTKSLGKYKIGKTDVVLTSTHENLIASSANILHLFAMNTWIVWGNPNTDRVLPLIWYLHLLLRQIQRMFGSKGKPLLWSHLKKKNNQASIKMMLWNYRLDLFLGNNHRCVKSNPAALFV